MLSLHPTVSSIDLRRLAFEEKRNLVVLFSGVWCPDCREFRQTWETWSARTKDTTVMLEVPRGGQEWKDWDLDEIPTVAAYKNGREVARVHGTITTAELEGLSRGLSEG